MNTDRIKEFTNQIILDIENGSFNFKYDWKVTGQPPQNLTSGHIYKGLNAFFLKYCTADTHFLTFLQAKERGIKIKAGEKGKLIVFYKILEKSTQNPKTKENETTKFPFLRYSYVFGLTQTENLGIIPANETKSIPTADEVINNYSYLPELLIGDRNPSFIPAINSVYMPSKERFNELAEYYSTLFHELAHSTAIPLKREIKDYAREELLAELSTAIICNYLGIESSFTEANSKAYLKEWIQKAGENPKYLLKIIEEAEEIFRLICFNEIKAKRLKFEAA